MNVRISCLFEDLSVPCRHMVTPYIMYKYEGETLAQLRERFFKEYSQCNGEKITYAGRLDPMAEGLMLFLMGDDVHHKEEFLCLDKVYEVDVLLGVSTDTGDILGMLAQCHRVPVASDQSINDALMQCTGAYDQPYPIYSSKTVDGVPLWKYARDGIMPPVIPTKSIVINSIELLSQEVAEGSDVQDMAIKRISALSGDFRQEDIIQSWRDICITEQKYPIIRMRVHASSGAYMRTLAERIGNTLNIPALAWRIKRVQVGGVQK